MKIIVCEDTAEDRVVLCSFINKFFDEINCSVEIADYDNGGAFLHDLSARKIGNVRIAFLDIYMPGLSGFDIARKIRETDDDMAIIITTTSLDHGLEGYSVGAMQYLVKPLRYADVEAVLHKCIKLFADSFQAIEFLSDRLTVRVLLKDILYIEVFDHACHIHTHSRTIKNYRSLDEIERQLDGGAFLRTHRSYIVNMRYISDVTENDFVMRNGALVPIRRRGKLAVKQVYRDYLFALARGV